MNYEAQCLKWNQVMSMGMNWIFIQSLKHSTLSKFSMETWSQWTGQDWQITWSQIHDSEYSLAILPAFWNVSQNVEDYNIFEACQLYCLCGCERGLEVWKRWIKCCSVFVYIISRITVTFSSLYCLSGTGRSMSANSHSLSHNPCIHLHFNGIHSPCIHLSFNGIHSPCTHLNFKGIHRPCTHLNFNGINSPYTHLSFNGIHSPCRCTHLSFNGFTVHALTWVSKGSTVHALTWVSMGSVVHALTWVSKGFTGHGPNWVSMGFTVHALTWVSKGFSPCTHLGFKGIHSPCTHLGFKGIHRPCTHLSFNGIGGLHVRQAQGVASL